MKEYYEILGLNEDATDEEIRVAYRTLKEKYREERFMEGERGNQAAKKLTQVETAYSEITAYRSRFDETNREKANFTAVENYIKQGKISEAQEELDNYTERNAEWHYLQSVIFYKKNWTNESKKQLEIAMNMEPNNSKYSDAYKKLKEKIEFTEKQFKSGNADFSGQEQQQTQNMGGCCDMCASMICINLLCNCCCGR